MRIFHFSHIYLIVFFLFSSCFSHFLSLKRTDQQRTVTQQQNASCIRIWVHCIHRQHIHWLTIQWIGRMAVLWLYIMQPPVDAPIVYGCWLKQHQKSGKIYIVFSLFFCLVVSRWLSNGDLEIVWNSQSRFGDNLKSINEFGSYSVYFGFFN